MQIWKSRQIDRLRKLKRQLIGPKPKSQTRVPDSRPNILMLVYDSCRYDSAIRARTPVLDQYCKIHKAYTPATYTYPAHQSFFCGIFPYVPEPLPYYNRFIEQLVALEGAGDGIKKKHSFVIDRKEYNIISGLANAGYYTVGSGGANWFAKNALRVGFQDFFFKVHAPAKEQIELVLNGIGNHAKGRSFFGFINFMETHEPYMHHDEPEYRMTARRKMKWPPYADDSEADYAKMLHDAQIQGAEYLDACLPRLFEAVPKNTIVLLFADHGEAFGEDGYWGHGVYHEKVMEVPLSIFSLQGDL